MRCSEHRREHCSCSVEHRKTHSLFTIKYSIEVIQGFNRDEHKCWFNWSLTLKFSGRCERAAYEYLMQESHIPLSHMKKVYENWVWVAAPGSILNHQDWPSIPIYISLEAYSRWNLIGLSAGSRKANTEGGIGLVLNSYSEPDIRDIHLWPVEFWENHRFFLRNLEASVQYVCQTFIFVLLFFKIRILKPADVAARRAKFSGKRKGLGGIAHWGW